MNGKRAALIAAFRDPPEGWERVPEAPCAAIRWRRTRDTPPWARERRPLLRALWDEPTYTQLVFLNLTSETAMPIMRVCRCPWLEARDTTIPLSRALAVLADPATALERP